VKLFVSASLREFILAIGNARAQALRFWQERIDHLKNDCPSHDMLENKGVMVDFEFCINLVYI